MDRANSGVSIAFTRFNNISLPCKRLAEPIHHSRQPQRFEVNQATRVLLRRPFSVRFPDQHISRGASERLLKPGWSGAQTCEHVRKRLDRKRKFKLTFEPDWWRTHAFIQLSPLFRRSVNH